MGALFWLSDEHWAAMEQHFPTNQPGARRVSDRRVRMPSVASKTSGASPRVTISSQPTSCRPSPWQLF